jgi:hypothetical protein
MLVLPLGNADTNSGIHHYSLFFPGRRVRAHLQNPATTFLLVTLFFYLH